ncbi:PDZ domain-containing protein [Saxibacter everestensis]|uniref:endopeptidase La n=1 Tax=Saxibacter everestensis TaxID=2909229 RepID=A0ABY8QNX7_9MICO|nr:PDZ domain-containing protein [Brevibacteriaceae bacterium ZFBP1038]
MVHQIGDRTDKPVPQTNEGLTVSPSTPRSSRSRPVLAISGFLTLVLIVTLSMFKIPYVIETPGPTVNTLGTVDGQKLINIAGHQTFPTDGNLDLLTVAVSGGPNSDLGFNNVLGSWFNQKHAVVPAEAVYPAGVSSEDIKEVNTAEMSSSQETAIAAALANLKIAYTTKLTVSGFSPDSPAEGKVAENDVITAAGGKPVTSLTGLQAVVAASDGNPVPITVERDGGNQVVNVTPKKNDGKYQLGVLLTPDYTFPFEVSIKLENIGGPSAGTMFALGIVDTLTPGAMTGGEHIAGTGTIDTDGEVGPIGGIRQKLYGAKSAGAEYFLAPADNCDEVVDHVPEGLQVIRVETLDDARTAVETIGSGGRTGDLPACTAK